MEVHRNLHLVQRAHLRQPLQVVSAPQRPDRHMNVVAMLVGGVTQLLLHLFVGQRRGRAYL